MKSDEVSNDHEQPMGTAAKWLERLKDAKEACKDYHARCDKIVKYYEAEGDKMHREFQIFWSNIEVLKPAVYARPPVPVVVPRFKDLRKLPSKSSEILERTLITNYELQDMDHTMKMVRDDYLLFGRGVAWLRYVASGGKTDEGGEDGDSGEDTPTISSDDVKVDFSESAVVEHISRRDFRHDPARKWSEVSWVAKCAYLTKPQFKERFNTEANMKTLGQITAKKMQDDHDEARGQPKIKVWEIWDKTARKVIWVADNGPDILDERDPHLQLQGFFPCPRPAFGMTKQKSLVPIPEFVYYKDQVEEINELTARISKLSEALKMKGFYAAGESELKDAIEKAIQTESNNAILVPVSNMAAFGGKSLKEAIVWLPVQEIAQIIQVLIGVRKQIIQDIYEITGISDIVRGATDPNETASAQKLKAQWGSVRIRERQAELARLARDVTRIMAEIMAENYTGETLLSMSQIDMKTDEQVQGEVQQIQAGAQAHIQKLQATPPPQQGQPPAPPPPNPEQIMKQVQAKIAEIQKTITIEKVTAFLQDQRTRAFSIEIEVDSTIQPDEDAEKQRRTEFLTSVGGFIAQMLPMVQQVPQTAPFAAEALKFVSGGFRAGRQLEGVIQEMSDQLKELPKQKQQGPSPEQVEMAVKKSVEGIKAQGAADKAKLEMMKIQKEMNTPPPAPAQHDPRPQQNANLLKQQEIAMKERVEMRKIAANLEVEKIKLQAQAAMKASEIQQNAAAQNTFRDGEQHLDEMQAVDPMAAVTPLLDRLTVMIENLTAAQNAPKQVVRDNVGNVIGIETARPR